ncbi:HNH endonuclease signature motif containing protein [Ferrimonas balearica]|uniref:HNH endonuclease n=1 Tax=Ferrimonas balearica TaxID=44012 RepID=UPI001C99A972|nr:HNH endonuclease signature motif containing protein [Ferrimonas balearica]MBY5992943.1 HNH endonuclease [Ferrimonas balearica]
MFEVGKIYKRKEQIHGVYGGQGQGGISTPSKHAMVLVFTSDAGENYGYQDQFRPDGTFWYTGEGQVGDMEMLRGNAAIRDHEEVGKHLYLFEYVRKAHVRYIGETQCVGHHIEERPDRDGNTRKAIIFHLALLPAVANEVQEPKASYGNNSKPNRNQSLAELRRLALQAASENSPKEQVVQNTAVRTEAIRLYALKRSKGICEGCSVPAPFQGKEGPFLEVHHLHRLSDGGPDHPANVIALCPNCHRRVHFGKDGGTYNEKLIEVINDLAR